MKRQICVISIIFLLLISCFAYMQVPTVKAVDYVIEDFESYNSVGWTNTTTEGQIGINSTAALNGSNGFDSYLNGANPSHAYLTKAVNMGTNISFSFLYECVEINVFSTTTCLLISFENSTTHNIARVGIYNNGSNYWTLQTGASFVKTYASSPPTAGNTYLITGQILLAAGTGFASLSVNGTLKMNQTSLNNADSGAITTVDFGLSAVQVGPDNEAYFDDLSITDTVAPADSTAPTYSGLSTSSTVCGASCQFNATFNDETDLTTTGGYIFSNDTSGSYVNSTWTAFTSTPETISRTQTLPNSYGETYHYIWYFNDTAGNWNSTGAQSLTTTADTYTVTLTATESAPSLGDTVTINIAVSRSTGTAVSSWQANITNNGGIWGVNYAGASFSFSEDTATTHTFDVTGLYDADCGATVTPTCADLAIVWSGTGGGGVGGGTIEPEPSTEPTPAPTDEGEFQLPELTPEDTSNALIVVIIILGGLVGAIILVNREPSRKSPRKQKSQLGRKKRKRESIL